MEKMKEKFEEMYSHWEIKFPEKNFKNKKNGYIQKNGWIIQYCFGIEESIEYMDLYAENRMTTPDHTRIYSNGEIKELSHYQLGYLIDKDPKITNENKKKYEEHNKKIAQEFIEKGFNRFTINGAILAGLTDDDNN